MLPLSRQVGSLFVAVALAAPAFGQTVFFEDFEMGANGWSIDNRVWEIGGPTSGPMGAISGTNVAATVLGGNYPGTRDSRLISPDIVLPGVSGTEELHLRFWQWFSYGDCDNGRVQVSTFDSGTGTWSSWSNVGLHLVYISPWSLKGVDLTPFAGETVRLAFLHTADNPGTCSDGGPGWYIDDVTVLREIPVFTGGFENDWAGWSAERGVWQIGAPGVGPATPFSGQALAGTALNGNYPGRTDSRLVSPTVTLDNVAAGEELHLRFRQWFSYGDCDNGRVQISTYDSGTGTWSGWSDVGINVVYISPWSLKGVELTAYAGETVRLAFLHTADNPGTCSDGGPGWYIDDVEIVREVPVFTGDFENDWAGWSAERGMWQIGAPTVGPAMPFSGQALAGTVLDGNYPGRTDSRLVSPTVTLDNVAVGEELHLRFRQWFSYGDCDNGRVQISTYDSGTGTWSSWSNVGLHVVYISPWSLKGVELTAFAGETVRLAFLHTADNPGTCSDGGAGWYIDDVEIVREVPVFTGDFENDWAGWSAERGLWQVGAPSVGPAMPFSGQALAGTVLDGNYPGRTDSRLVSPTVTLDNVAVGEELHLRFRQWFAYGDCDNGRVQISTYAPATSTWSSWSDVGLHVVYISPWSLKGVELTAFAGETVRLAFLHIADNPGTCSDGGAGWYIDDVAIVREVPVFTGDFENDWAGWSAERGVWQIGSPTAGPMMPFSGQALAGTVLNGNYPGRTDSRLVSPSVRLGNVAPGEELYLRFQHWFSYSGCDRGYVQISTLDPPTGIWSAWMDVAGAFAGSSPWSVHGVELTAFAGQIARLAFFHTATNPGSCSGSSSGWYIDDVQLQRTLGTIYCSPAVVNSTGSPAEIRSIGSSVIADAQLDLLVLGTPPGQFGYFLAGQTQGAFTPPGAQGVICLDGNIGRFNAAELIIQRPSSGIQVDLSSIPVNPTTAVQPGDTWHFQCWYRDNNPALTSNFSDAVTVTFQ